MRLLEMFTRSSVVTQSLSAFQSAKGARACSRTSEHAESLCDDVLQSAYWQPPWRHTGRHRQRKLQLHRASPLWAAALACARENRVSVGPRQYRRPHSAMPLSKTSPRILCLWQKWHRLDQALIFTGLTWFTGLVGPFASLALPAGGCLLAFDRPSMFLFSRQFRQERGR